MSLLSEVKGLAERIGGDVDRFVAETEHALEQEIFAHGDPGPLFDVLRETKPILRVHDIALVTRFADVAEILTNDAAFGVEPYDVKMQALAGDFILGMNDSHAYQQDISVLRLAAPSSDIPGLAAFLAHTADELVDEAKAAHGSVDVADLSRRAPARLMGRWFGTPGPDETSMIDWTMPMFEDIFINVLGDSVVHRDAMTASVHLHAYLAQTIAAHKRAGGAAKEDVLGRLLDMQADSPEHISDAWIVRNLIGLIVGFIPTVGTAVPLAIDALLDRPDALARAHHAAANDDDETLRQCLWEAMRLNPFAPGLERKARTSYTLAKGTDHETTIPAGTTVFAATESAMQDPREVTKPQEFRLDRPDRNYLHFGTGLHQCFGRFANAMQIPGIAKSILRRPGLERASELSKNGLYARSLKVTYTG